MGPDDSAGPSVDTLCGDVLWVDRLHGLSTACHALDGLTYQPLESEQQQHGPGLLLQLPETKWPVLEHPRSPWHCLSHQKKKKKTGIEKKKTLPNKC